jgi:hypothetical protein
MPRALRLGRNRFIRGHESLRDANGHSGSHWIWRQPVGVPVQSVALFVRQRQIIISEVDRLRANRTVRGSGSLQAVPSNDYCGGLAA